MSAGHSRYGGSIADRWMNCPGSVALCASVPELPGNEDSSEGTRAHKLAEMCLKNGVTSDHIVDVSDADRAMADAVSIYLDAVYAEMALTTDAELYVEQTFTFEGAGDGQEVYGSNDAIVYHPSTGRLVVFDYKHGVGVAVSADDNAQLKFYAAGAILSNPSWRITEIWLCIVQPRAWNKEDGREVSWWNMDPIEVMEFNGEIEVGVEVAKMAQQYLIDKGRMNPAYLQPGPWCRYSYQCDAAAICPAKEREALDAMTLPHRKNIDDLKPDALLSPETIATDTIGGAERIGKIIAGIEVLQAWANQVRAYAEGHMMAGTLNIPGWKVVEKVGRRKWVADDAEIIGCLELYGFDEDMIAPRKVVTITEAERLLKAEHVPKEEREDFMLRYTAKESSGLTIAPDSDKRPAVDARASALDGVKIGNFEL